VELILGLVMLLLVALGGYAYGIKVGHAAGVRVGRAAADAEWQTVTQ